MSSRPDPAFPILTPTEIDRVAARGRARQLPGVFAVGDVRGGNIKRVASAVGEGSIAVAFVHRVLHE
jgi:thioredoxin reductase